MSADLLADLSAFAGFIRKHSDEELVVYDWNADDIDEAVIRLRNAMDVNGQLQDEVQQLRQIAQDLNDGIDQGVILQTEAEEKLELAQKQIAALNEALDEYGQHFDGGDVTPSCERLSLGSRGRCTCGLDKAKAAQP